MWKITFRGKNHISWGKTCFWMVSWCTYHFIFDMRIYHVCIISKMFMLCLVHCQTPLWKRQVHTIILYMICACHLKQSYSIKDDQKFTFCRGKDQLLNGVHCNICVWWVHNICASLNHVCPHGGDQTSNHYDCQKIQQVFPGVPVHFKHVFTGISKISNKISRE